ncbi:velvet factor [Boletus reticuloceps]|uniref:Velvet factor n=1 Tax=Boletus reticuloceps TaxID=495285 RepID=A0A8I2YX97_9AGAM|nr:velvet factor [Boletus reticuloceps]
MIQKSNTLPGDDHKTLDCWGQWWGQRHYSLQVVQHPLRARMCGFGDKDRRPLAPAAVAKMVVRREDNSIVDVDELDFSFFLVTVDLWSADGTREMNLVLHPSSSTDRYLSTVATKPKKSRTTVPTAASPRSDHPSPPSSHSTPNSAPEPPRPPLDSQSGMSILIQTESPSPFTTSGYSYTSPDSSIPDSIPYSNSNPYTTSPDSPDAWSYPPAPSHGTHSVQNQPLRNAQRTGIPPAPSGEPWNSQSIYRTDADTPTFRTWPGAESSYQTPIQSHASVYNTHDIDRPYHSSVQPDGREYHQWNHSQHDSYAANYDTPTLYGAPAYPQQPPQTPYYQASYPQSNTSSSSPPATSPPLTRHVYTRTLVGPLSCNACRLLDEHQIPGIFFLFQDLSVRTEGTFRLRLRLMNVGDSSTPEADALRVHTHVSPVLAQTFTDPFVVFSAKRFPGVPETTALSIAFGNQGQKLPLVRSFLSPNVSDADYDRACASEEPPWYRQAWS